MENEREIRSLDDTQMWLFIRGDKTNIGMCFRKAEQWWYNIPSLLFFIENAIQYH